MKRLHVHIAVKDLKESVRFYSTLFGQEPSKLKEDYAKWMLDDPSVNFAISDRGQKYGLDHLGVQVDSDEEFEIITKNLQNAERELYDQGTAECCYAKSVKAWVKDPSGIAWETYRTMADIETFGPKKEDKSACCVPEATKSKTGCC